jgi:hypothetical protein
VRSAERAPAISAAPFRPALLARLLRFDRAPLWSAQKHADKLIAEKTGKGYVEKS